MAELDAIGVDELGSLVAGIRSEVVEYCRTGQVIRVHTGGIVRICLLGRSVARENPKSYPAYRVRAVVEELTEGR